VIDKFDVVIIGSGAGGAPIARQLVEKGIPAKIDVLRADLEMRDARDRTRSVAPLKPAQDALLLDNSAQTIEQSVAQVLDWWEQRNPFRPAQTGAPARA